jgi:hypothetical protein
MYINGQAVAPTINVGIDDKTTPDYVTDGLIALYDGIKNTRSGHADGKITAWEDLSGNNNDLVSTGQIKVACTDGIVNIINDVSAMYYSGTLDNVVTAEIVFDTYATRTYWTLAKFNANNSKLIAFINSGSTIQLATGQNGFNIDVTKRNSLSIDYGNYSMLINGESAVQNSNKDTWGNSTTYPIILFSYGVSSYAQVGGIQSVRLYNRTLTAEEKAHNLAIDVERYGIEVE